MESPEGITQLLVDWGQGNQAALNRFMPLVYAELRRLATNALVANGWATRYSQQPL